MNASLAPSCEHKIGHDELQGINLSMKCRSSMPCLGTCLTFRPEWSKRSARVHASTSIASSRAGGGWFSMFPLRLPACRHLQLLSPLGNCHASTTCHEAHVKEQHATGMSAQGYNSWQNHTGLPCSLVVWLLREPSLVCLSTLGLLSSMLSVGLAGGRAGGGTPPIGRAWTDASARIVCVAVSTATCMPVPAELNTNLAAPCMAHILPGTL